MNIQAYRKPIINIIIQANIQLIRKIPLVIIKRDLIIKRKGYIL